MFVCVSIFMTSAKSFMYNLKTAKNLTDCKFLWFKWNLNSYSMWYKYPYAWLQYHRTWFFSISFRNSYESMNKSIVIFYSQSCRIKAYVVKTTSFELKKYKSLWHVQWAALRQRFISQKFLLLITSTERNIRKYLHAHFTIVLQNIQSSQAHKLKQTAK